MDKSQREFKQVFHQALGTKVWDSWFTPMEDNGLDDLIQPLAALCFVLLLTACSPSPALDGILSQ